jgi:hypothetical protein
MITYIVKARLAVKLESGAIEVNESKHSFENTEDPISARQEAFSRYMSYLDIVGDHKDDPERNLSEHISKFSKRTTLKLSDREFKVPVNDDQIGVNLYFIVDEDFQMKQREQEYLIIGDQEERNYLTLAENLTAEMAYYKEQNYPNGGWTTEIKYWDYESDKENDIILTKVLFTPFNFWENWNPDLAKGYIDE